jgi:hypothetical protein
MKEQFNIVIQFDKNWIVKPRYTFQNLPLSEVMDRMMGNMDANETEIGMETTILDDGYEKRFLFIG